MDDKPLSPREKELVQLAVEGYTNDGIANKLGISPSTVDTYWLRIRTKVKGESRTAIVAEIIREKAAELQRISNVENAELAHQIEDRQIDLIDLRVLLSLLRVAMVQLRSAVWTTDLDLRVSIIANVEMPDFPKDMAWEVGSTIFEVFHTDSEEHPAVAAHLKALAGLHAETKLSVNNEGLLLSVQPLIEDDGSIIGCIGVMTSLA